MRVTCQRAPAGWVCTREDGHEGPCAAVQVTEERPEKLAALIVVWAVLVAAIFALLVARACR